MKDKYYFPILKETIGEQGLTQDEFKQKAHNINSSPSYRSWSLAMSKNNGLTKTYANRAKSILEQLGFDSTVCDYQLCKQDPDNRV